MSAPVYIIGGEQTDFERNWSKEGKTFLGLMKEAVEDLLCAVPMSFDDIARLNKDNRIAVFVGNFDGEQYFNQGHLGAFLTEIDPSFYGVPSARYEAACASSSVAIDAAATKIRAGEVDVGIVIGMELMKTVRPKVGGDFLGTAAYYDKEARGVEFPFPRLFSRLADVILEKHKLGERRFMEALAEIATINYENAKRNPKAQTRKWFMNREHARSRQGDFNRSVGGRLCASDCSQVTDGAAAVVLASNAYASEYARRSQTALCEIPRIKGWGHRVAPVTLEAKMKESRGLRHILPWTARAVEDAYQRAGLSARDIDFFEAHDCFTSSEYVQISCFGLASPGEEYRPIESGTIRFGGAKPVNPSGGLIGVGHPVGATGARMIVDLYKQLTHRAGDYQVKGAKNGLMLNIGGTATTNFAFVVGL